MAATVYEGMLILDSTRYARDPEGVANQIHAILQESGGEILVSRLWEERRLAYPIKGHRKGIYWLVYFRLEGTRLGEIRHKYAINDSILRTLFLKVDPRIVDTLVAHARTGQFSTASRSEAAGVSEESGPESGIPEEEIEVDEAALHHEE